MSLQTCNKKTVSLRQHEQKGNTSHVCKETILLNIPKPIRYRRDLAQINANTYWSGP